MPTALSDNLQRHCERSEAAQVWLRLGPNLDCLATIAMTAQMCHSPGCLV